MIEYFGIKTPKTERNESYIWWITSGEHSSWSMFLNQPNENNKTNPLCVYCSQVGNRWHGSISEAIRAYEAIGYKCVELKIVEIEECICKEMSDNMCWVCPAHGIMDIKIAKDMGLI